MKNITIVLQRSELNYLIKYDALKVSSDRIINFSFNEFKLIPVPQKISILQYTLPIYEQDHEVLFIEYNSQLVTYDNAPLLEFKGILSIIPLTETGARLLSSKLNTDFNILDPLDSKTYKAFVNNRNHILRYRAGQELCLLYDVPLPEKEFITDFNTATLFQINGSKPGKGDSMLAHLVDFNVTPSFIPEGNIEALIKSACVGMKMFNQEVGKITRSRFFNFVIEKKEVINRESLYLAIKYIEDEIEFDKEGKEKFKVLNDTLSENGKFENAFLLCSFFYYLKKVIEKNDFDVSVPKDDILELKHYNPSAVSRVLFMLGYTFSIQTISKSIQSFSDSKLLKTEKKMDLEWIPVVKEQKVIKESLSKNKMFKEDEKSTEIQLSVENKNDEKSIVYSVSLAEKSKGLILNTKVNDDSEENEQNELYIKDNETDSIAEVKINNESDTGIGDMFSNTAEITKSSLFTFREFENNIKQRKLFSPKILKELKALAINENEITKQILIECLKQIDIYKTKKGGLKVYAKDALKIFE